MTPPLPHRLGRGLSLLFLLAIAGCSAVDSASSDAGESATLDARSFFTVGGQALGLADGQNVLLALNGAETIELGADGAFDFETLLSPNFSPSASQYEVAVSVLVQQARFTPTAVNPNAVILVQGAGDTLIVSAKGEASSATGINGN